MRSPRQLDSLYRPRRCASPREIVPGNQRPTPRERVWVSDRKSQVIRKAAEGTIRTCPGSPGYAGSHVSADVARSGLEGEVRGARGPVRACRQDARRCHAGDPPVRPSKTAIAVVRHARTSLDLNATPDLQEGSVPTGSKTTCEIAQFRAAGTPARHPQPLRRASRSRRRMPRPSNAPSVRRTRRDLTCVSVHTAF